MRIGIDASRAVAAQPTGTEHYSLQLIRHLLQLNAEDTAPREVVLYTQRRPAPDLFGDVDHYRVRAMPLPRLWTHLRLAAEMLLNPPDVLFVPAHVLPLRHPLGSVATIHDLGHLHYPGSYPKATLKYLAWSTKHNVRNAAHLLADSEATKADIIEHFAVTPERITVVYPGVSPQFTSDHDSQALNAIKGEYGIEGAYILYVGTLQPRKNVERLIEAFAKVNQRGLARAKLVLVGRLGWLPEGIMQKLEELGEGVTLAGYVPDVQLSALYAGATAFVLPSLFEGFGMPLVEAMASGAPVIASDTSCIPEIVGDAGILFDPHSTDALVEALAQVCSDQGLRAYLRGKGFVRSKAFTWEAAAARTLAVLDQAGQGQA